MAQIKIYGLRSQWSHFKAQLSDSIHACAIDALGLPAEKRFHRFLWLADEEFVFPADRSPRYLILEISMFEGRSIETKKQLIRTLFERLERELNLAPQDLEITIFETPRENWGTRGQPGDELTLSYRVEV
jgi:phenylpyruvate tautomerase PptA (4-oxalocrotonate tautomerase family)